jgi:hypothetical protein
MRQWRLGVGMAIAAMESTSSSRKAPVYCLDQARKWLLSAAREGRPGPQDRRQGRRVGVTSR